MSRRDRNNPKMLLESNYNGFPSKGISDAIGLKLYTEWALPMDIVILNEMICGGRRTLSDEYIADKWWVDFVMFNPFIVNWVTKHDYYESLKQKRHIIMGMVSMFNEDDIREFITLGGDCYRDPDYHRLSNEVQDLINLNMAWVASTKTLNFIKDNYMHTQMST